MLGARRPRGARRASGFPAPVHLERFASPARLCVTDEPRLAGVGGIGMLVARRARRRQLGQRARARARSWLRPPRQRAGPPQRAAAPVRLRARRGARAACGAGSATSCGASRQTRGAPVVLEFAGPSARLLSVGERAVLAALAPQLGAAAALFVSDERTEVFLRDQRRSKAHRALVPDAGAPCEEVVNLDLGAVDPLLLDERGQVRAVRDLAGQPVTQVLLGGDSGVDAARPLRGGDAPQEQARARRGSTSSSRCRRGRCSRCSPAPGALTDLIATGARLVEPDARVVTGRALPAAARQRRRAAHVRSGAARSPARAARVVASAETLAYAVATGEVGDPRSFKRPVRVTVPRALPTDDVLVARKAERGERRAQRAARAVPSASAAAFPAWKAAQTLELVEAPRRSGDRASATATAQPGVAVVCATLDEVRDLAARAPRTSRRAVRAVLAPYIPSALVALLSAAGIAALRLDAAAAKKLEGQKTIALPAPSPVGRAASRRRWPSAARSSRVTWLALGAERAWADRAWATGAPDAAPRRRARAAERRGTPRRSALSAPSRRTARRRR